MNIVLINSTHNSAEVHVNRVWCFCFFALPSWCQMSWWTYRFMLTHSTDLWIYWAISLYKKLSTCQNLPYLKQSFGEMSGEDCQLLSTIRCEWWNRASATDDAAEATNDLFTFLRNQEHSVNNERLQSIQSVCHSKWTHHMWPHQKDPSAKKKKETKVSRTYRSAGSPVEM